jgi:hypothetical protein
METYKNLSGTSGVMGYEIGVDSITVQFQDESVYVFNVDSAGKDNIEKMKELAVAGEGLNRFINQHVKQKYAARL